MITAGGTNGYYFGVVAGVLVGAWFVFRWGLWGHRPQWKLDHLLAWLIATTAVVGLSQWFGTSRGFWLAAIMMFPLGLLPLLSVAASAHSYVAQMLLLASICIYTGVLLGLGGAWTMMAGQLALGGILLLFPALFWFAGLLGRVQDWNDFFWRKLRQLLRLPATPGK